MIWSSATYALLTQTKKYLIICRLYATSHSHEWLRLHSLIDIFHRIAGFSNKLTPFLGMGDDVRNIFLLDETWLIVKNLWKIFLLPCMICISGFYKSEIMPSYSIDNLKWLLAFDANPCHFVIDVACEIQQKNMHCVNLNLFWNGQRHHELSTLHITFFFFGLKKQ